MAEALARGEHNNVRIGVTLFRDKLRDYTAPGGDGHEGLIERVKDKIHDIVE